MPTRPLENFRSFIRFGRKIEDLMIGNIGKIYRTASALLPKPFTKSGKNILKTKMRFTRRTWWPNKKSSRKLKTSLNVQPKTMVDGRNTSKKSKRFARNSSMPAEFLIRTMKKHGLNSKVQYVNSTALRTS